MDRTRAAAATDEAAAALDELAGQRALTLAAVPDEAMITTDHPTEWCPAPTPCVGRPAFVLEIPVRVVDSDRPGDVGAQAGTVEATYCPQCRHMASRNRQAAA